MSFATTSLTAGNTFKVQGQGCYFLIQHDLLLTLPPNVRGCCKNLEKTYLKTKTVIFNFFLKLKQRKVARAHTCFPRALELTCRSLRIEITINNMF